MAATGQTEAHVPHDMHVFGSILHFAPSSEIAITGHTPMQVWHPMHLFGSILYGISGPL
jgi:hypothetical protein